MNEITKPLIPRIELLQEKKLMGKRATMSLLNNQTGALWRSFMPHRQEIRNTLNNELYSVEIYGEDYFRQFSPATNFEKWAAVEVSEFEHVPPGMETLQIPGGLYSVFLYKGAASEVSRTFQYIFSVWLPASDYVLDYRPHIEVMGEKYQNEHPASEEELWIPVKPK